VTLTIEASGSEGGMMLRRAREKSLVTADTDMAVLVSISSTFYAGLCCTKVLFTAFLLLQFDFVIFLGVRILAQNLFIKCWEN